MTTTLRACPRCKGHVDHSYISEAPRCVICGWYDRDYEAPKVNLRRDRWLSGSVVKLRYIGFAPALEDAVLEVSTKAPEIHGGREIVTPTCPLACGLPMKYNPVSGGPNKEDLQFRCVRKHQVFITAGKDGQWRGWM